MEKTVKKRRTQAERRASTQKTILEATLRTLGERGYANMSMSSITEEASVSKGAISHHFASKAELVASAMQYFYREITAAAEQQALQVADHSFRDRMFIKYRWSIETLPIRLEFMTAMRTDLALREAYLMKVRNSGDGPGYSDPLLPELGDTEVGRRHATLMSAVLLGLGLLGSLGEAEDEEASYKLFIGLLERSINE